jgi:hypothetical protein
MPYFILCKMQRVTSLCYWNFLHGGENFCPTDVLARPILAGFAEAHHAVVSPNGSIFILAGAQSKRGKRYSNNSGAAPRRLWKPILQNLTA